MSRMLPARLLVALVIGVIVGIAVGKSMQRDVAQGKTLTMKEYIEDFDHHKDDLLKGDMSMASAVVIGTLMVIAAFGLYELLVFALDRLLGVFWRRRDFAGQPGTPPPW